MQTPNSWHFSETSLTHEGIKIFRKKYVPNSFEFKNELRWLMRLRSLSTKTFLIPEIQSFSEVAGTIDMKFIESFLIPIEEREIQMQATLKEIRTLENLNVPLLKRHWHTELETFTWDYRDYLTDYVSWKLKICMLNFPDTLGHVRESVVRLISEIRVRVFSLVHRDMRLRHMLQWKNDKLPYLIDWEFSNISDHCQDVAKAVYDVTLETKRKYWSVFREYSNKCFGNNPWELLSLEHRMVTYSIVISLEHLASMLCRKANSLENGECFDYWIKADIQVLNEIYEQIQSC